MKTRAELAEAVCEAVDNWYFGPDFPGNLTKEILVLLSEWNEAPLTPPATPTLNWRPHTEVPVPEERLEAHLIAEQSYGGCWFIVKGPFCFASRKGEPRRWLSENEWKEYKPDSRFFWLPEAELLATLPEMRK